jgi:creatinine amidohydrolase
VQTTQLDLKLCLNVNPSTQLALLATSPRARRARGCASWCCSTRTAGTTSARGAGAGRRVPLFVCVVNWWQVVPSARYFDEPGDHAGELETSAMLHAAPAVVRPLGTAGPGHERRPTVRALRERWAWAPRPWTRITADTGVGDPRAATADKGARFVDAACAEIADFLVELAAADLDALYATDD